MNIKKLAIIFFLVAPAGVCAEFLNKEKSKLEVSLGFEKNVSSKVKKGGLSWDIGWTFDDVTVSGIPVKFSTKPYYKYSETDLVSEKEKTQEIGLDVVKATFEFESVKPYISAGIEQLETDTTDSAGFITTVDETLTSLGFGLIVEFGNNTGASLTLYSTNKYEGSFETKATDESGVKISVDLIKILKK